MDELVRLSAGAPASALLLADDRRRQRGRPLQVARADRAQPAAALRPRAARRLPTLVTQRLHPRRPGAPALQRLHVLGLRLRPRASPRDAGLRHAVRRRPAQQQHRDLAHPPAPARLREPRRVGRDPRRPVRVDRRHADVVDLHPADPRADPGAGLRRRLSRLQRDREHGADRPRQPRCAHRRRDRRTGLHGHDDARLDRARARGVARHRTRHRDRAALCCKRTASPRTPCSSPRSSSATAATTPPAMRAPSTTSSFAASVPTASSSMSTTSTPASHSATSSSARSATRRCCLR